MLMRLPRAAELTIIVAMAIRNVSILLRTVAMSDVYIDVR